MQQQPLQPLALQERIQTIDIIRGFAIFGILVVNFTVDNPGVSPMQGRTGLIDQLVYWPISFFMNDKFMAIFCFLFGLGFSIQMLRAESHNSPFVVVYFRRLLVLYLISIVQDIFIGPSILEAYAMTGMLLLILYKLPRRFLPVLALLCFLIPATLSIINIKKEKQSVNNNISVSVDNNILDTYTGVYEGEPGRLTIITREGGKLFFNQRRGKFPLITKSKTEFIVEGFSTEFSFTKDSTGVVTGFVVHAENGSISTRRKIQMDIQKAQKLIAEQKINRQTYKDFVVKNAKGIWNGFKNWSWREFITEDRISGILPLFLIGLYAGRRKIFTDSGLNKQFLTRTMWWCFILGVTGITISTGFDAWNFINDIKPGSYSALIRNLVSKSWELGAMILALGYVAALTLMVERMEWKKRLSFLIPLGRMALTNFLLQAIARTVVFENFGFGLAGKIGPFWRLILALLVFMILIFISHWWFKRFRMGPVEWLWRSLTYLKFQPMRLKEADKSEIKETGNI